MADWARSVLKFTEKSAKILIEQKIDGASLLTIPSRDELEAILPSGAAIRLWGKIVNMKNHQAEIELPNNSHVESGKCIENSPN